MTDLLWQPLRQHRPRRKPGEGFAFFAWRVMCHQNIGGDADWWEFWSSCDFYIWRRRSQGETDG